MEHSIGMHICIWSGEMSILRIFSNKAFLSSSVLSESSRYLNLSKMPYRVTPIFSMKSSYV